MCSRDVGQLPGSVGSIMGWGCVRRSGHPTLYGLPFQNHLLVTEMGTVKEKAGWWLIPKSTPEPS